jgi:hypothetical protein
MTMTMRRNELNLREQLRAEYYRTKDLEPHQRPTVSGGPKRHEAGRRCECDALLSIYNPGPGCRKCNAADAKTEGSLLWAIRFGEEGTIF